MHHTVKPEEIKAQQDAIFAQYWDESLERIDYPDSPLVPVIREACAEAFNRGFAHGLMIGAEQGTKIRVPSPTAQGRKSCDGRQQTLGRRLPYRRGNYYNH